MYDCLLNVVFLVSLDLEDMRSLSQFPVPSCNFAVILLNSLLSDNIPVDLKNLNVSNFTKN